jgi:hypothetical protein
MSPHQQIGKLVGSFAKEARNYSRVRNKRDVAIKDVSATLATIDAKVASDTVPQSEIDAVEERLERKINTLFKLHMMRNVAVRRVEQCISGLELAIKQFEGDVSNWTAETEILKKRDAPTRETCRSRSKLRKMAQAGSRVRYARRRASSATIS